MRNEFRDTTVRRFGEAGHESLPEVPVPVGQKCLACGEAVQEGDSGFVLPFTDLSSTRLVPQHLECMFMTVLADSMHETKIKNNACICTPSVPEGTFREEAKKLFNCCTRKVA